jgi:4-amino-4-deoxy-L-arabinose transferase-like glycosyltransferase
MTPPTSISDSIIPKSLDFAPLRSIWPFLLLITAYLMLGVIGHDPWKQDETYIFGIIHHILNTGDWVVPTVAGEPFMEKPPLYYWLAVGCARLFSPLLALHNGARFATPIFMGLACLGVAQSSRLEWGKHSAPFAVLLLLSSLGILLHSHMMLTDIPALTGMAIALWGFSLTSQTFSETAHSNPSLIKGGLLLGIGLGTGFLAKGVLIPGVIGLTAFCLPLFFAAWRTRYYAKVLLIGTLAALPFLLIWPIALYQRSPALFMEWFWMNNVGRFLGFSVAALGAPHEPGFWWINLPWFTFPILPLALLTLWSLRHRALKLPAVQVSCLLSFILMAVLGSSASARANYALPLLAPISLLAVPGLRYLPLYGQKLWDYLSRALFLSLSLLIVYVWGVKQWRGMPPQWTFLTKHLPSQFNEPFSFDRVGIAVLLLVLCCWEWFRLEQYAKTEGHEHAQGLISWMLGMTLFWGLVSMLWMPWLDEAKSYRSVFLSMHSKMPASYSCMESLGLGESERAMLRYFLGINTLRREVNTHPHCSLFLIDGLADTPPPPPITQGWHLLWEGARNGDFRERLWLYQK